MEEFRWMINESIRNAIQQNFDGSYTLITSRITLRNKMYHYFKSWYHTSYIAMSVFAASAIIKNYKKKVKENPNVRFPYVRKPFIVVDKNTYKIIGKHLLISIEPRKLPIGIPLNDYVLSKINQDDIRTGQLRITPNKICITLIKQTPLSNTSESCGIDINLNNATAVHSDGTVNVFSVTQIIKIKERYRKIKSHFRRNDIRIRRKIFQKYGIKQQNRTNQILHNISKKLTTEKKQIILEDLKGIRKLYRRWNGQSKKHRAKMNSWPFYELRRQLEYKSGWYNRIPIILIKPAGTSTKCSICGSKVIPEENRMIECRCGHREDRDINAARNILYKGVRWQL